MVFFTNVIWKGRKKDSGCKKAYRFEFTTFQPNQSQYVTLTK